MGVETFYRRCDKSKGRLRQDDSQIIILSEVAEAIENSKWTIRGVCRGFNGSVSEHETSGRFGAERKYC